MHEYLAAAEPENPRAVSGGNRPPLQEFYTEQNTALPGYLEADSEELLARAADLLAAFERMPTVIETADVASKFSDQIAQFTKCIKAADAKREDIKAGPLAAGRLIDGFFAKNFFTRIGHPKDGGGIKAQALKRLTVWEQHVAAIERQRLEEEARIAREAAAEAERLAQVERDRKERADREAAEAERLAQEAMRNETDMARALAMEAENKRLAGMRAEQERIAAEDAENKRQAAEKAARDAQAKASELHTVRGDLGSSSSLRTTWKARRSNKDTPVDLNALRDFIGPDVVEKAANAYAKIHKDTKPVTGLVFYEETSAVVRG